jgi:hypothetical protein
MAVIEAIETVYLEADVASVTFSSLGSYEHLQLRCSMKSDRSSSSVDGLQIDFNDDGHPSTAYSYHWMRGSSTTASAGGLASGRLRLQNMLADDAGETPAANFGVAIIDILDYRNANKNTTVMALMGTTGTTLWSTVSFESGLWDNTDAVTKILLDQVNGPNFMRGSEFTLYGLKSS